MIQCTYLLFTAPMASHGIPWERMAAHVGCHVAAHGRKTRKIVLKASALTRFHAVIWWLMTILDDYLLFTVASPSMACMSRTVRPGKSREKYR